MKKTATPDYQLRSSSPSWAPRSQAVRRVPSRDSPYRNMVLVSMNQISPNTITERGDLWDTQMYTKPLRRNIPFMSPQGLWDFTLDLLYFVVFVIALMCRCLCFGISRLGSTHSNTRRYVTARLGSPPVCCHYLAAGVISHPGLAAAGSLPHTCP